MLSCQIFEYLDDVKLFHILKTNMYILFVKYVSILCQNFFWTPILRCDQNWYNAVKIDPKYLLKPSRTSNN